MSELIPGIIMSFREGLEAFLILVLIIEFLDKTDNRHLDKSVLYGFGSSVLFSVAVGFLLFFLGGQLGKMDEIGKLWESVASLIAVGLVTTFIIWMINHGSEIKRHVEDKTKLNLNKWGLFIVSFVLIAREGVEIAIFSFAGEYHYASILLGLILALFLTLSVYLSLFKVKLTTIFQITLIYLIIQAGYLLGYGIHEGLSAMKTLAYIPENSPWLIKAFNLSGGILNHKQGLIGLPANILLGWYSKPEWIQFSIQYIFTFSFLGHWYRKNMKQSA